MNNKGFIMTEYEIFERLKNVFINMGDEESQSLFMYKLRYALDRDSIPFDWYLPPPPPQQSRFKIKHNVGITAGQNLHMIEPLMITTGDFLTIQ
jgi:hypothetical protein